MKMHSIRWPGLVIILPLIPGVATHVVAEFCGCKVAMCSWLLAKCKTNLPGELPFPDLRTSVVRHKQLIELISVTSAKASRIEQLSYSIH